MHLFITKSLGKEYHSSWNSCACLCALVAWMMILLIPFLVGYYTDGFYLNNVVLYD